MLCAKARLWDDRGCYWDLERWEETEDRRRNVIGDGELVEDEREMTMEMRKGTG